MQTPDAKTALRLFREFVLNNATQWKLGAFHGHPMWELVAETLGEQNSTPVSNTEWQFIWPTNRMPYERNPHESHPH